MEPESHCCSLLGFRYGMKCKLYLASVEYCTCCLGLQTFGTSSRSLSLSHWINRALLLSTFHFAHGLNLMHFLKGCLVKPTSLFIGMDVASMTFSFYLDDSTG